MDTPKTLLDAVRYFSDLEVCEQYMVNLKWPNGAFVCPKCGGESIGRIPKRRKFKCNVKSCQKQFAVKTGTLMEDSPLPLSIWFAAIWAVANGGIGSTELAEAIEITQRTAWSILHRITLAKAIAERKMNKPERVLSHSTGSTQ